MDHLVDPRESDRLESLASYRIGADPEPQLEALVAHAAEVCKVPMAFVALVYADEVRLKAGPAGFGASIPRAGSLSDRVVRSGAPVVVGDIEEERGPGARLPLGVRAFVGVPMSGRDGLPIGVVCATDVVPRRFTDEHIAVLRVVADAVMNLLEVRRLELTFRRDTPPSRGDGLLEPARLRAAVDAGEFVPFFQPIVDLFSARPVGFEALLRWRHPELGLISPQVFLPSIEVSRLILPIGRRVLHEALRLFADLRSLDSCEVLGVTVNVSPVQLEDEHFAVRVLRELEAHRMPPEQFTLELTETAPLLDESVAVLGLRELREAGVAVAVDDYGVGYSTLARVLDLPISAIKLDKSLVRRLPEDPRSLVAVRTTVQMAQDLGLAVVAEGIERVEQHQLLTEIGCQFGQGYLFGRPLAAESVSAFIQEPVRQPVTRLRQQHSPEGHRLLAGQVDALATIKEAALATIESGGALGLVVTPSHRDALLAELVAAGENIAELTAQGRLVVLDAEQTVAELRDADGCIDARRFQEAFGSALLSVASSCPTTVVSDMGATLWDKGLPACALLLEDLCNTLRAQVDFEVLCPYDAQVLTGAGSQEQLVRLLDQHSPT